MTEKYESLFKIIRENQFENDSVSSKNGVDQIRNWSFFKIFSLEFPIFSKYFCQFFHLETIQF